MNGSTQLNINGVDITDKQLEEIIFLKLWKQSKYIQSLTATHEAADLVVDVLKAFEKGEYPDPHWLNDPQLKGMK